MSELKLCKDCKFFSPSVSGIPVPARCTNPLYNHKNMLYGHMSTQDASAMRSSTQHCSFSAKGFEQKIDTPAKRWYSRVFGG